MKSTRMKELFKEIDSYISLLEDDLAMMDEFRSKGCDGCLYINVKYMKSPALYPCCACLRGSLPLGDFYTKPSETPLESKEENDG